MPVFGLLSFVIYAMELLSGPLALRVAFFINENTRVILFLLEFYVLLYSTSRQFFKLENDSTKQDQYLIRCY